MDESSVSFHMFLIPLSFITLGSKSQISVYMCSSTVKAIVRYLGFFSGGEHAQKPKFREKSEKKIHKALRSVQLLASFISFYFEILSYLACGEKIIRLAPKSSVKFGEKLASDFKCIVSLTCFRNPFPVGALHMLPVRWG